MKANNVFELIGYDENAFTKSLAYLCNHNRENVLRAVLSLFGIKRMSSDVLGKVNIDIQVHEGKEGITDIEFELEDKFIIILEAKIGVSTTPTDWEKQLQRYHNVLIKKTYPAKKLIFVSDTMQTDEKEFSEVKNGIERKWISWKEIYKKLNEIKEMDDTVINRQFMQFFKEILMEEEIIIVPIGDLKGDLDVNTEWKIIENEHFYRKTTKPREARYIAFYTQGIGIEKMAKLKLPYTKKTWGEINKIMLTYYPNHKFYSDTSETEPGYLMKFDKIFNLPRKIPHGGWGPQRPICCTFEELLTAESVKKLHSKATHQ